MTSFWETFQVQGKRVGVILRRQTANELNTLTCFTAPEGPVIHLEHRFSFENSPYNWSRYSFEEFHGNKRMEVMRKSGQLFTQTGDFVQELPDRTLPSYATFLVLQSIIRDGLSKVEFNLLVDGDPYATPRKAALIRRSPERVSLPNQAGTLADRVDQIVLKEASNSHWVDSSRVLKSDWRGAESFWSASREEALDGLDDRIIEIASSFN